jgi:hypothetical protein
MIGILRMKFEPGVFRVRSCILIILSQSPVHLFLLCQVTVSRSAGHSFDWIAITQSKASVNRKLIFKHIRNKIVCLKSNHESSRNKCIPLHRIPYSERHHVRECCLNHEGLSISHVVCYITCYFSDFPSDGMHCSCLSYCRNLSEVPLHGNHCCMEEKYILGRLFETWSQCILPFPKYNRVWIQGTQNLAVYFCAWCQAVRIVRHSLNIRYESQRIILNYLNICRYVFKIFTFMFIIIIFFCVKQGSWNLSQLIIDSYWIYTMKLAHNGTARDQGIFFAAGMFRVIQLLAAWIPGTAKVFSTKDRFPLCPGSV